MADSSVLEDTKLRTTNDGDHDTFSHYVNKAEWGNALLEGKPVTALCGKTWHPDKDEKRYEVCPTCKDTLEKMFPA